MAFTWSKSLETNNLQIDNQHKELIEAINRLLVACSKGKGRQEIISTTKFLNEYTKKHFGDEEKLQLKYKYPDYENHKKLHEGFIKVVKDITEQLENEGPTIILVGKVNNSIGNWLITHITREDVKVAKHIKANNI